MKKSLVIVVGFMLLGLLGCASTGGTGGAVNEKKVEKNIVEKIPSMTPDWVIKGLPFEERNEKFYYVASVNEYEDLDVSKKVSFAEAQTMVARQIKETIRTRFGTALEATGKSRDDVGVYTKNIFISKVDDLQVSGIVLEGVYSEQIQEIRGNESKLYWRTYTLVSLPVSVYKDLVSGVFSKTSKQVSQNNSAKELLKEAEKNFYNS